MPYISYNGQLYEITQAQYDSYTIGGPLPSGAILTNASNVAAGGTVTLSPTSTGQILTPNTVNNTPGQLLTTTEVTVDSSANAVSSTQYTASNAVTISNSLVANSSSSVYAAATAGLTAAQLLALGGADPTDPYIRSRLGLPALADVQTLSGAIANVNFSNVGNAVGNLVTSFGNAVGNISFSDIGNVAGNLATSFGNAIGNVGDLFSTTTANAVPASDVQTISNALVSGDITANEAQAALLAANTVPASAVVSTVPDINSIVNPQVPGDVATISDSLATTADTTTVSTAIADAGSGTTVGTDTNAVPASQIDTAPAPVVDYNAGLAGTDPVATTTTQTDTAPASDYYASPDAVGPPATDVNVAAADVAASDYYASPDAVGPPAPSTGTSADSAAASSNIQGLVQNAQAQATIASQRKQINNGDWRVRLRLAPLSNYLYNAPNPGILQPLKVTDGIIFPYTPAIDTNYRANYEAYDLTHSNYRGYFYKNSYVDAINLKAIFTAQDTTEANYLLAVITFLKSATKMFYGQDAQRGAPPPLVYLTGLGDYQFRENPCLINAFTYNLPADVDYIRAGSPNNVGLNLTSIRDRQSVATNSIFGSLNRLAAAFLTKGAVSGPAAPPTLGLNRPTYVPTKMEINLTLYPVQSRQQVSQQFSVKEFANGNLIKGGFW